MNYTSITSTVLSTITAYGQPIKVVSTTGASISTYGIWGEMKQEEVDEGAMGNITVNTNILYIPHIKVAPVVGGTVIVNKITYSINKVTSYQPTDSAIAYELEVKG